MRPEFGIYRSVDLKGGSRRANCIYLVFTVPVAALVAIE